ncbi:hypothetical protein ACWA1F_22730 [Flavobacterium sp. 3-218]
MKKIVLATIALLSFGFAQAQDGSFKVGAHVGFPMGDAKDFYSLNLGIDAAYLWKITDKINVGATTGFSTYLAKDYTCMTVVTNPFPVLTEVKQKGKNASYIPVAGTAQYSLTDKLFVGADLGYAISVGEGDGGFLYQPKFGYQTEKIELYASYKGISNDGSISSINLGFNYKL